MTMLAGASPGGNLASIRAGSQVSLGPPRLLSMALVSKHAVVFLLFFCSPKMETL